MNKILGIDIPADLGALSPDDLKTLASSIRDAAKALVAGEVTPAQLAEIKEARAKADEFATAADEKVAEQEAFEAEVAAERAALADDQADDADAADKDEDADKAASAEAEVDEDGKVKAEADAGETEGAADKEAVTASAWRPTAAGAAAEQPVRRTPAPQRRPHRSFGDVPWLATAGIDGKQTGEAFGSVLEIGEALADKWGEIAGSPNAKVPVARTFAKFKPEQILDGDMADNYAKFGGTDPLNMDPEAITAAICAPAEPLYELATTSSTARPVKASMATYNPRRGNVTVYPTPKLASIDDGPGGDGRGIWTQANDANLSDTKVACARIACDTSDPYGIWGLYRCMTIKNMMAMTFPELVDAYANRLGALTARLGESTLLDGMIGSVNAKSVTIDASSNGFDGGINLWTTIVNLLAVYREEERYADRQFDGWLPRWTIPALQIGQLRQRRTSGKVADRIATEAELTRMLRDLGLDVTWTLDDASTWTSVEHTGADGDPLPDLPHELSFIVTPKGNFRVLDRGELTIGVTTNGIYRDNVSNSKNEFTIFQEGFEGILDFGATTYVPTISGLCFNGAQTADVVAIDCAGS